MLRGWRRSGKCMTRPSEKIAIFSQAGKNQACPLFQSEWMVMSTKYLLSAVTAAIVVLGTYPATGAQNAAESEQVLDSSNKIEQAPDDTNDLLLPPENFVLRSALRVNLTRRFARLPLHRGSYRGQ